jgi:predicted porin
MQKKLIALALASAFAAPAFAATSNVDLYGIMSFSTDYINTHDASGDAKDIVTGRDNVSRFGLKGSEDLGGGLAAIWQIEMQLNANDANSANYTSYYGSTLSISNLGRNTLRNTFVGLKGGFGTVVMGRHDTPYKLSTASLDLFADQLGDYNAIIGARSGGGASGFFDVRAGQTIAYISPSFNGLTGAIAYVEAKANEGSGIKNTSAWSLAGMYGNGPIYGSLAYERHNGLIGLGASAPEYSISSWKAGLGVTLGDFKVGGIYENTNDKNGSSSKDRAAWLLNGSYTMGNTVLKAEYGVADDSNASGLKDGAKFYALGADYNLSKRTKVFGQYAAVSNDSGGKYGLFAYSAVAPDKNVDGLSIGITHSF